MEEYWKDITTPQFEGEIWKSLDFMGYPNYEVSTLGRVKSLSYHQTGEERILSLVTHKGYLRICLWSNNKGKHHFIHRLVAQAFIPNPQNKKEIDHIDTNPLNNRVENLRWVTRKENSNNPLTRKHITEKQIGDKGSMWGKFGKLHPRFKIVIQLTLEGEYVNTWYGVREAGRILKIKASSISACCRGQRNQTAGFKWVYA